MKSSPIGHLNRGFGNTVSLQAPVRMLRAVLNHVPSWSMFQIGMDGVRMLRAVLNHMPSWSMFQIGMVCVCCMPFWITCRPEACFRLAWCAYVACRSESRAILKHVSDWHGVCMLCAVLNHVPSWSMFQIGMVCVCCVPFWITCHPEACFRLAWCAYVACRSESRAVLKHVSDWHGVRMLCAVLNHVPSWSMFQIGMVCVYVCRSESRAILKHVSDWHDVRMLCAVLNHVPSWSMFQIGMDGVHMLRAVLNCVPS